MEMAKILNRRKCDIISTLFGPILLIILGLLVTKEAVQTCVLSKRGDNLWTSLPFLNINLRDSQTEASLEGMTTLLWKITNVELLELHFKYNLRLVCYDKKEGWNINIIPIPLVVASPRRYLEMVEVNYWRFDPTVNRLVQKLMLGTGGLRNFRTYRVINGRYGVEKTYKLMWSSYRKLDWAIVNLTAVAYSKTCVEATLQLIY